MAESESPAETIFFAAIERETPEERARYVQEACAGDEALRRQVERLLRAQPRIGDFLQAPADAVNEAEADLPTHLTPAAPINLGTLVGPYKLLQQISEGGMAVVFLAEQTRPIQRKVALKLIKPGRDTRQVVARFEAERQALALMDLKKVECPPFYWKK